MNKESKYKEIRTDYVDDNGVLHMDGFKTNDDNEQGTISIQLWFSTLENDGYQYINLEAE